MGELEEMLSDKNKMLRDLDTLAQERIGIIRLRKENSNLYGYYLNWIIKKEQKLIKKYRKKYGKIPRITLLQV